MSSETQTVGEFLFDYIHKQGVGHVFGIPGDFALPTFRWMEKSPLEIVTMTHEPSVGFAADAYARLHGLGVACVTYCVGGLNMLNSVACAYAEKSPIVVISGGPSPKEQRNDALVHHKVKTFDTQRRIFEEVTCANTVLNDPDTAASEIMRVFETVKAQCRPGYIEVPYDVVDMPIKITPPTPKEKRVIDLSVLGACVEDSLEFINNARQPVIIAGVELHRHGITEKALELAKKTNIPIAATLLSKSVIRETNPLYIGVYSSGLSEPACKEYIDNSDCLILLGTFITDVFMGMVPNELEKKNSLLVTTEHARVGYRSYETVDLEHYLDAMLEAPIDVRPTFENPSPPKKIKTYEPAQLTQGLTADMFFNLLESHMGEGSTLICDVGDALLGAIGIRTHKRRNFFSDAYYLSMGFAVPAAIGVCADAPKDGRVFAIVGDGAFQMTGLEISTAAKYGMAPIILILNNDGYGTQRHIIDGPFNNIHQWKYHKVPELLGTGKGYRCANGEELDAALKEAVASHHLSIIEAIIPRDDCSEALRRLGEGLSSQRDVNKRNA